MSFLFLSFNLFFIICCCDLAIGQEVSNILSLIEKKEEDVNTFVLQYENDKMEYAKLHYQLGRYYQYDQEDPIKASQEYEKALEFIDQSRICSFDCSGMLNDLGVMRKLQGDFQGAEEAFRKSIQYTTKSSLAYANLAELKTDQGEIQMASTFYQLALESDGVTPEILYNYARFLGQHGNQIEAINVYLKSIEMKPNFPHAYEALGLVTCQLENFNESYSYYQHALQLLSNKSDLSTAQIVSLHRIKFQQALGIIPKFISSKDSWDDIRQRYIENILTALADIPTNSLSESHPLQCLGCSSIGYYLIYQGKNDLIPRQLHSLLYQRVYYDLLYLPIISLYSSSLSSSLAIPTSDANSTNRPIRVGFLSAYFYHHSVGLLLQGVIKNLSKQLFTIIVFFLPPMKADPVSESIHQSSDESVFLLDPSLNKKKQEIINRNLDILIFGEIGMNLLTYLLACSRLADKSLVFWGHAITSGIIDYSSVLSIPRISSVNLNSSGSRLLSSSLRGGPDYFISSILFENHQIPSHWQQQRYSERLILQEGMTTFFEEPISPLGNLSYASPTLQKIQFLASMLSSLHWNDTSSHSYLEQIIQSHEINVENIHLYGIPQTLYKLSPKMMDTVREVLVRDSNGLVFLPEGSEKHLSSRAIQHLKESFPIKIFQRILFLRQMKSQEFLSFCGLVDVVMDTFPVGGGRSSFEIFSTGTPIIVSYPDTSILQLTYGMYRTMGIDYSCCVTYSLESYIQSTLAMAQNKSLNNLIRSEIMKYKSRLYRNQSVLIEWERMLQYVHHTTRPVPFFSSHSSHLYPSWRDTLKSERSSGEERNQEEEDSVGIHSDIVRDILTIEMHQQKFNLTDEEISLALSIPFNENPIRLKDEWRGP